FRFVASASKPIRPGTAGSRAGETVVLQNRRPPRRPGDIITSRPPATLKARTQRKRISRPTVQGGKWMLIPPPCLGEELWACVRKHWRKGRVVMVRPKTVQLALLRPMPETPLTKEVTVGWAYVATEHELRRERPADALAMEWQALERPRDDVVPAEIDEWY